LRYCQWTSKVPVNSRSMLSPAPTTQPLRVAQPPGVAKVGEEVKSRFVAADGCKVTMITPPPLPLPPNQQVNDGGYAEPKDPRAKLVCSAPPVWIIDDFLSPEDCAAIVQENDHRVHRSRLANQNSKNESRTSSSVSLCANSALGTKVKMMIADTIGIRPTQCEQPEMVRYQPGQQYKDHFDWLHGEGVTEGLAKSGQRVWTFLIYLVEVPDGGETRFSSAEPEPFTVKPKLGRMVVWRNMLMDGRVDPRTLHAGLPPIVGTKYVLNTWTRTRDVNQTVVKEGEHPAQLETAGSKPSLPMAPQPSAVASAPTVQRGGSPFMLPMHAGFPRPPVHMGFMN